MAPDATTKNVRDKNKMKVGLKTNLNVPRPSEHPP